MKDALSAQQRVGGSTGPWSNCGGSKTDKFGGKLRNSEQAEQKFRRATGIFWDREDPVTKYEWEYHHSVAEGLTALAVAIRDIYGKLEEIQRDIRSNSMRIS